MTVDTAHRAPRARVPGRLHALGRAGDRALPHRPARRPHRGRPPRRRARARAADRVRPDHERRGRARRRPLVEVGPAGRVQSCTWVSRAASPASSRSTKPFAFALVRPDGADTALLHAVDCGTRRRDRASGMRVAPRWRAERTGHITDIEAWVPLGDGEEPNAAPVRVPAEDEQPVTGIVSPIRLEYSSTPGSRPRATCAASARARSSAAARRRADEVYAASRGTDPMTGEPTSIEVEVQDTRRHHDVLRRQRPGSVGARAGDPVRVRADPARRRQQHVLRPDPRRRRSTRCAWACG